MCMGVCVSVHKCVFVCKYVLVFAHAGIYTLWGTCLGTVAGEMSRFLYTREDALGLGHTGWKSTAGRREEVLDQDSRD